MEKVNNNSNDNSGADNVAREEKQKFMNLFREHCCDIFWIEGCESLEWLFRI